MSLPDILRVELLREMLPKGWQIIQEGETIEQPMDEVAAAEWLHMSVLVLRSHRTSGTGTQNRKAGRSVIYLKSNRKAWVEGLKPYRSTAECRAEQ
jgi:hypothetical protein